MAYLHENKDQFTEALNLAVFKTGLGPEIIEKDYYVTMILKKLSEQFEYAVFKGGTSLQKFEQEEQRVQSYPYQMLLKVRAYDKDDNPVFKESAQVHFVVEDPARIIGVENGDMQSLEPKTEDRIHLYHGKAAAALV